MSFAFRVPAPRRSAAILLSAGVLLLGIVGCHPPASPDVMATVNGKPIMKADLERVYQQSLGDPAQPPSKEEAALQHLNLLHQMIVDEIMQQRAAKLNLVATDEEVNVKLTDMKALATQEEFNAQLKQKGLTLDDVRRDLRRSLTLNKLQNKEILSKVNITDAEIGNWFNSHKSDFNQIEPQYHLARILVTNEPSKQVTNLQNNKANNDAEAKKKIQMLRNRLDAGDDFLSIATRFSEDPAVGSNGGDYGLVNESQLQSDPEIFNAISKLKPGQYTETLPVMRAEGSTRKVVGYAIYLLMGRRPAGQRELNDPNVQQFIRQLMRNNQAQLLQTAYNEMLYNEAKIHNYLAERILKDGGV